MRNRRHAPHHQPLLTVAAVALARFAHAYALTSATQVHGCIWGRRRGAAAVGACPRDIPARECGFQSRSWHLCVRRRRLRDGGPGSRKNLGAGDPRARGTSQDLGAGTLAAGNPRSASQSLGAADLRGTDDGGYRRLI